MSKYRVTIDGRTYEVVVEDVGEGSTQQSKNKPEVATPEVTRPELTDVETKKPQVKGTDVPAPLSGTILSVKVNVGDQVKKGDVILTLEALKLENEILAPVDGKVLDVVKEGQTVENGQSLAVIG